jgi:hypothetical protein
MEVPIVVRDVVPLTANAVRERLCIASERVWTAARQDLTAARDFAEHGRRARILQTLPGIGELSSSRCLIRSDAIVSDASTEQAEADESPRRGHQS